MSPRSVSDLERGISRTARKDTALLLAGALGLAGPARELFVAVARGQAPTAQTLAAARGAFAAGAAPGLPRGSGAGRRPGRACVAAGDGDRFSLPRAGRVRGARRGVVLRPGGGRRAGAGADIAAGGGPGCWWCRGCRARASRRCCGRGCCRGSGWRGWRPRRARRRGPAWCSPRPGRRWMSWRCGWRCWREPMRPRYGGGWRPRRGGSPSPRGRPPWRGHPGRTGGGWPRGRA